MTPKSNNTRSYPCAGIIVFNTNLETVLVKTEKGHYSFPKGKKEFGEYSLQNAVREMTEETGIPLSQISIIPEINYYEMSKKGNPSVCYYLAFMNPEYKTTFKYDPDELIEVKFWNVDEAIKLDGLKDSRKNILEAAYEKAKDILVTYLDAMKKDI